MKNQTWAYLFLIIIGLSTVTSQSVSKPQPKFVQEFEKSIQFFMENGIELEEGFKLQQSLRELEMNFDSIMEIMAKEELDGEIDILHILEMLIKLMNLIGITPEGLFEMLDGILSQLDFYEKEPQATKCLKAINNIIPDIIKAINCLIEGDTAGFLAAGAKILSNYTLFVKPKCKQKAIDEMTEFFTEGINQIEESIAISGISNFWWGSQQLFNYLYCMQQGIIAQEFFNAGECTAQIIQLLINGATW